jgi:hypothetical protein
MCEGQCKGHFAKCVFCMGNSIRQEVSVKTSNPSNLPSNLRPTSVQPHEASKTQEIRGSVQPVQPKTQMLA